MPSLREGSFARAASRLPGLRDRGPGHVAYESSGARRPCRRGRHSRRDRASRHRRPGRDGRGRRSRRHVALQPRLPADALRHRRSLGGARRPDPCGRTNLRIKGWMGRADQTTKVEGCSCIRSRWRPSAPASGKARLVVENDGEDRMTLPWSGRRRPPDAGAEATSMESRSCGARCASSRREPCPTTARSSTTCASSNDCRLRRHGRIIRRFGADRYGAKTHPLPHDRLHAGSTVPREGAPK